MPASDAAVAGDHYPRLQIESLYIGLVHRIAHDAGSAVFYDLNINIDRRCVLRSGDLFKRFAFIIAVGRTACDKHLVGAAYVAEAFCDLVTVVVLSAWNKDRDSRCPRRVRVGIGRDIEARSACFLDDSDSLGRFSPYVPIAHLYMRYLDRKLCLAADADRLTQGIEHAFFLVADMGHINAVIF